MADLDRIDALLIQELQNDARISNKDLADRVHLAPSSCLARVRRLREDGVFTGFHADVDPAALGIGLQALVQIRLDHHTREVIEEFRAHALDLEEVVAVWHLTGSADFLVHLVLADADHLREFMMGAFTTRAHIAHLETAMVYSHDTKVAWPNLRRPGAQRSG